jgi:hypothetical protein
VKWRALGLGLWLLGCAGTETGNPSFDGTVGYDAYTTQPSQVALLRGDASVVVETAWLMLGDVQLDPCGGEAVDVPGLGAGDHVGSQAPVTHVELRDTDYCEASIALQPAEQPSAAPAELKGHSILLTGTYEQRPFRILSALDMRVSLDTNPAEGFGLDAEHAGVLFAFDVAVWLRDLPWSKAMQAADGTLLIDAEHSPEPLRAFETQVVEGIRLYGDTDGDGKLDADRDPLAGGWE